MCPLLEDPLPVDRQKYACPYLLTKTCMVSMLCRTFNMKLGSEDAPAGIHLGWQASHRAGRLQER